eukprot:7712304-Pyramimonas_sp.AAC.2
MRHSLPDVSYLSLVYVGTGRRFGNWDRNMTSGYTRLTWEASPCASLITLYWSTSPEPPGEYRNGRTPWAYSTLNAHNALEIASEWRCDQT